MKVKSKIVSLVLAASLLVTGIAVCAATAQSNSSANVPIATAISDSQGAQDDIQGANVLHCFDWSYNSIRENLADIAAAGYTAVQTSPVQPAKDYNASWTDQTGQWWKLYQPIDICVADSDQTWLGSKEELEAMCAEAESYGIKVVVDIVANHMANVTGTLGNSTNDINTSVNSSLRNDTSCWHLNSIWADDGSRYNMTQGSIGMPDLNTGNSKVQQLFKDMLVELIDMGVDGFRFDAAKHIELPTDSGCSSNFWPVVIDGSQQSTSEDIYYYGEILNSAGTSISNYTKYMSVTDNYSSDYALVAANNQNASGLASSSYNKGAGAAKSVLWVESHDTYMGSSGSAGLSNTKSVSDSTITKAWAIVGARANATSLFFARPAATMGDASTDTTWKSTAVAEVNKFKNYFAGENEYLSSSGSTSYIERGTSGVVISKLDGSGDVNLTVHQMADGDYIDQITGEKFTVSGGKISGTVGSSGVAVVYNAADPAPTATVSPASKSYKTDTLTLTLGYRNATSGEYSIDGSAYTAYTDGDEITIGSGKAYGTVTEVSVRASNGDTTSQAVTYYYTKTDPSEVQMIYFDNSSYNWSKVYAYVYDESGDTVIKNAAWPGVEMSYNAELGLYELEISEELANGKVIFTESYSASTNRYPADGESGLPLDGSSMLFSENKSWTKYTPVQPTTSQPTTAEPTNPVSVLIGDVNLDDVINIDNVTEIQLYIANYITLSDNALIAADVDKSSAVTVDDATAVQYYLIDKSENAGSCGQLIYK